MYIISGNFQQPGSCLPSYNAVFFNFTLCHLFPKIYMCNNLHKTALFCHTDNYANFIQLPSISQSIPLNYL